MWVINIIVFSILTSPCIQNKNDLCHTTASNNPVLYYDTYKEAKEVYDRALTVKKEFRRYYPYGDDGELNFNIVVLPIKQER